MLLYAIYKRQLHSILHNSNSLLRNPIKKSEIINKTFQFTWLNRLISFFYSLTEDLMGTNFVLNKNSTIHRYVKIRN